MPGPPVEGGGSGRGLWVSLLSVAKVFGSPIGLPGLPDARKTIFLERLLAATQFLVRPGRTVPCASCGTSEGKVNTEPQSLILLFVSQEYRHKPVPCN